MSTHQVMCINKSDRPNPHEAIRNIGGVEGGTRWRITQQEAVEGIESGKWSFYVNVNGKAVKVIVAVSQYGNKYIKTEADKTGENNLLSLPECP